ncbi:MAG: transporter substrate-binding domain-containing protein [Deltaproteobacteria bacterium]|nr:transporter substrate-binding domain-containing protein [Deltaproteobacteria bacterium]
MNKQIELRAHGRATGFVKNYFFQQGLHRVEKMAVLFLLLLLTVILPVNCGNAWGAEGEKIESINVVTPQWDGQTNADGTGLFFEIVRRVYEPHGIKLTYHFVPWKRAQQMVGSSKADAMLCVWREHAREEGQLIPHFPMFVEYTGVVFKKGSIVPWQGIKSLDGKSAVWLRGYDYHTFDHFAGIHFRKWTEVDDYDRAWLLLSNDRYDVYIDALIDLDHFIASKHVDMTLYQLETLWGENAYVAFSPTEKSKVLMDVYDTEIQKLFNTGALKKIYEKWGVRFPSEAWQPGLKKSK